MRILAGILAVLVLAAPVWAEEENLAEEAAVDGLNSHEYRLLDLSQALGALHHLRPLCRPEERDLWRERMKELVKIEQPSRRQVAEMTSQFNDAFGRAQAGFRTCDRATVREAKIMAENAARVANALIVSLEP